MNTNPENKDSRSLNFNRGGNSPPANLRYNGSPLAAFKMDRGKLVAIITGAISLILAIAYLLLVQLLDLRGEMIPAPQSQLPHLVQIACLQALQL